MTSCPNFSLNPTLSCLGCYRDRVFCETPGEVFCKLLSRPRDTFWLNGVSGTFLRYFLCFPFSPLLLSTPSGYCLSVAASSFSGWGWCCGDPNCDVRTASQRTSYCWPGKPGRLRRLADLWIGPSSEPACTHWPVWPLWDLTAGRLEAGPWTWGPQRSGYRRWQTEIGSPFPGPTPHQNCRPESWMPRELCLGDCWPNKTALLGAWLLRQRPESNPMRLWPHERCRQGRRRLAETGRSSWGFLPSGGCSSSAGGWKGWPRCRHTFETCQIATEWWKLGLQKEQFQSILVTLYRTNIYMYATWT